MEDFHAGSAAGAGSHGDFQIGIANEVADCDTNASLKARTEDSELGVGQAIGCAVIVRVVEQCHHRLGPHAGADGKNACRHPRDVRVVRFQGRAARIDGVSAARKRV